MKLKYKSTTEQIEAIHVAYNKRWPGRKKLNISVRNDSYVVTGASGNELEISMELACIWTAEQFVEFLAGKHP